MRTPLSRDRIVRAAMEVADRDGLTALTMRRLGQELGVEAMSLYKHVANKDDLLDGLADLLITEIDLSAADRPWREAMRRRAESAREVFGRHPWATTLLQNRATPGPALLNYYDSVLGSLRRGGFSVDLAGHAFALLDSFIYGFALQEASLPSGEPADLPEVTQSIMDGFGAGAYPYLTEMATHRILKPGYAYADEFTFGLELILDALEDRLAQA